MAFCAPTMREIIICDYDAKWPALFEDEKLRITSALPEVVHVTEHIGSTAVSGLGAKPIIDIMIGVQSEVQLDVLIGPIETLGYEYVKKYEDVMPYRRFFRKETNGIRSHHIHAVARTHEFWLRHITFRNWLRSHNEDAKTYETLKRELSIRYRFDSDRYTDAKSDFIEGILNTAFINAKTAA